MQPTDDKLALTICEVMHVNWSQVLWPSRGKLPVATARQLYHYICHIDNDETQIDVGKKTNRHHTTVLHSCTLVRQMLFQQDPLFIKPYREIMEKMKTTHER